MQDEQDIRAVIVGYFEALYDGDVAGFRFA